MVLRGSSQVPPGHHEKPSIAVHLHGTFFPAFGGQIALDDGMQPCATRGYLG